MSGSLTSGSDLCKGWALDAEKVNSDGKIKIDQTQMATGKSSDGRASEGANTVETGRRCRKGVVVGEMQRDGHNRYLSLEGMAASVWLHAALIARGGAGGVLAHHDAQTCMMHKSESRKCPQDQVVWCGGGR